jgi:hypothetical protein
MDPLHTPALEGDFMASYLQRFDAAAAADRWPLVRRWMWEEPLPLQPVVLVGEPTTFPRAP